MAQQQMSEAPTELREMADGVAFWRSRPKWPVDFHNSAYEEWALQNPNGNFTPSWWQQFLPVLKAWKATRRANDADLTARFTAGAQALSAAWRSACLPFLSNDISTVTWDQVQAFPTEVGKIKPTLVPSPVFRSKFCHFLLPKVFPVVDNKGLGNRWLTYEAYFIAVQDIWASTEVGVRALLVGELTGLIEGTGQRVFPGFPMANKIVELRLIGRRHPRMSAADPSQAHP